MTRLKTGSVARETLRKILEPKLNELIEKINAIAAAIREKRKPPLVIIDDLDKLRFDPAKELFQDNFTTLAQVRCHVVFCIPIVVYFSKEFVEIGSQRTPMPNVKVFTKENRDDTQDEEAKKGREYLVELLKRRIDSRLLPPECAERLARHSGGNLSQIFDLARLAVHNALDEDKSVIELQHVYRAEAELRNQFRRQLSSKDRAILACVAQTRQLDDTSEQAPLLHIKALFEYSNVENWIDVNPVLLPIVDEYRQRAEGK